MFRCIYCLEEKDEALFNKEHVIPQAFGKFGASTPTLINAVCKGCNDFFAKVLDPVLSRDTYEGITRHAIGIKSREARPQNKVKLSLPDTDEYGEYRGARVWLDGTRNLLNLHNQIGFLNIANSEREYLTDSEIQALDTLPSHLSDKGMVVFGITQKDHDRMVSLIIEKGWIKGYDVKTLFPEPAFPKETKPLIAGTVDEIVRRALAKVAMNFAAKYIGLDEVLSARWNEARNFIRHGTGEVKSRASNRPFWGDERDNLRIGPSEHPDAIYNIRIENQKEGIVAVLEFSHIFLHEILLVEGGSIAADKEIAFAFTPGKEPMMGKKFPIAGGRPDTTILLD